jgi:tetratricopeptide (TPR) repeat protein
LRVSILDPKTPEEYQVGKSDFDKIKSIGKTPNSSYLKGLFCKNGNHTESREDAIEAFVDENRNDPFHYDTYDQLIHMYLWKDNKVTRRYQSLAVVNMTKKAKVFPNDSSVYFELSQAYRLPRNGYGNYTYYDSTLKYLNIALHKGYDSLIVINKRAQCFKDLKMFDKSLKDYQWLLSKSKSQYSIIHCYWNISNSYRGLKQFDKEVETIKIIGEKYPKEIDRNYRSRLKSAKKDLMTQQEK